MQLDQSVYHTQREILLVPSVRGNACIEIEGMVRMIMPARIGVGLGSEWLPKSMQVQCFFVFS